MSQPKNTNYVYLPTNDLNRFLREYGRACVSDTTPPAPDGFTNVTWNLDNQTGTITAYVPTGGGSSIDLQTNGTNNGSQSRLNLQEGTNVTITDGGSGTVTISSTAAGGGVNPGDATQLSFYETTGSTLSATQLTTNSDKTSLTIPSLLTSGQSVTLGTLTADTVPNAPPGESVFANQSLVEMNISGAGFSLGNAGGWSVSQNENTVFNTAQRGISQNRAGILTKHAVGDTAGIYSYVFADGGISAQSDEGVTAATLQSIENPGYFHGTVVSTTSKGGTPTLTHTGGSGWTTDGAFLLNITQGTLAGNLNGATASLLLDIGSGAAGTFLNTLPITGVTLPISTAIGLLPVFVLSSVANSIGSTAVYTGTITGGSANAMVGQTFIVAGFSGANNGTFIATASSGTTLTLENSAATTESASGTASITIPLPNVAANNPIPVTVIVNLAKIGGITQPFTVNSVISVAGSEYPEQSIITAVTTPVTAGSNTQQTLTMKLRNPNTQAILFQGGIQGQYISFDANLPVTGQRSSYYSFGSLTGSDLIYGFNVLGNLIGNEIPQIGAEMAQNTGANSGFHLYPGAEIVANTNQGFVPQIEQNGITWAAGDAVENPHYPAYSGSSLFVVREQFTPTPARIGSNTVNISMDGAGTSGAACNGILLTNSFSPVNYTGSGGPLAAPTGIRLQGTFSNNIFMDQAPDNGTVLFVNNNNTAASGVTKVVKLNYGPSGDGYIDYHLDGSGFHMLNFTADTGMAAGPTGFVVIGDIETYGGIAFNGQVTDFVAQRIIAGGTAVSGDKTMHFDNIATGEFDFRVDVSGSYVTGLTVASTGITTPTLAISGATTATSATGGAATALPASPLGYMEIVVNSTTVKVPYYSV